MDIHKTPANPQTFMHKFKVSPYLLTPESLSHTIGMHLHFAILILAKLCLQQQSQNCQQSTSIRYS